MSNINYISSAKNVFLSYKKLADKSMAQLQDVDLFRIPNEESNSIAIIVKHMWGNMLSRWTDFLTTDGEKPWRERDSEFENDWSDKATLLAKWEEGWKVLFNTLDSLTDADLDKTVLIRAESHTVLEAINRQIAHYASHVGQIIYIAKMYKNRGWETLSIARGKSQEFNAGMMGEKK